MLLGSLFCTRVNGSAWQLQGKTATTMSLHRLAEQGFAADCQEPTLRFGPWQQLKPGVRRPSLLIQSKGPKALGRTIAPEVLYQANRLMR